MVDDEKHPAWNTICEELQYKWDIGKKKHKIVLARCCHSFTVSNKKKDMCTHTDMMNTSVFDQLKPGSIRPSELIKFLRENSNLCKDHLMIPMLNMRHADYNLGKRCEAKMTTFVDQSTPAKTMKDMTPLKTSNLISMDKQSVGRLTPSKFSKYFREELWHRKAVTVISATKSKQRDSAN